MKRKFVSKTPFAPKTQIEREVEHLVFALKYYPTETERRTILCKNRIVKLDYKFNNSD